jgi:hypothetical protein
MAAITRRSQLYAQGIGAGPIATAITSAAGSVADVALDQVQSVTMRSQLSEPIHMTAREAMGVDPTEPGLGTLFMRISKPEISLNTTLGTIRIAPWGEPTLNLYPFFLVGTMVGAAALAGLVARAFSK